MPIALITCYMSHLVQKNLSVDDNSITVRYGSPPQINPSTILSLVVLCRLSLFFVLFLFKKEWHIFKFENYNSIFMRWSITTQIFMTYLSPCISWKSIYLFTNKKGNFRCSVLDGFLTRYPLEILVFFNSA